MKNKYLYLIFAAVILLFSLRGHIGTPTPDTLNTNYWTSDGPFELSPERGRFALVYSLLENKSFFFSIPLAQFSIPDLGYINGHYVSLFAPGLSYIVMPGYVIGKLLGSSQLGAYAVISIFALLNVFLIRQIAVKLGFHPVASTLGALTFLFATPAFNYAVTLYQHHVSTFLILLSLYLLLGSKKIWSLALVWFLCAMSIPLDYPNLILMAPIGIWALANYFTLTQTSKTYHLKIKLWHLFSFLTVLVPLAFFLWFNLKSYQNPLQFSGTVESVKNIDANGNPANSRPVTADLEKTFDTPPAKSALSFFQSRYLVNGLYLELISPDRGIIVFTPVILLSILGAWVIYRKNRQIGSVIIAVMLITLILYALWGDPWGGWAFGSRYLIPLYGLGGICIAAFLDKWRTSSLRLIIFSVLFGYSVIVNTAGALTSSANPPQVEAANLEQISGQVQRYSFDRNIYELRQGVSKSFIYESYLSKFLTSYQYYEIITGAIIIACLSLVLTPLRKNPKNL